MDGDRRAATYVLVHGGGSTARFWDRLVPLLDAPALAINLPGRWLNRPADLATVTVDDEVASVIADIEQDAPEGPIVLVTHSSGGLVAPGVAAGLRGRVSHVVLNAALVPDEGGLGIDCMKPHHREGLVLAVEQAKIDGTAITMPGAPADPEQFREAYGGDPLSDDDLAFATDPVRCVPDGVHHYFQPVHWSVAGDVDITYILNERDRPIPTATQTEMITRLPGTPTVVRFDTGHLPAVTHTAEFAAVLRGLR